MNRTGGAGASGVEILKHLEYLYHSTEYIKQLPFVPRRPFTGLRKKRRPEIGVPFAGNLLHKQSHGFFLNMIEPGFEDQLLQRREGCT